MPVISLPYGKEQISVEIADDLSPEIIMPPVSLPSGDAQTKVKEAITHPVGDFTWEKISSSGNVAIAINDKTRPVPNAIMIPPILEKLTSLGFKPEQITFFIATGTHTPMRSDEFPLLLPQEIIDQYKIVSHDCDDMTNLHYLGETTRQIPVWINSAFYHSNVKILVGNIEPHHFMGYSGGAKTASIGLTGRETINKNHAMLVEPTSTFGVYAENSTRQDVEEMGDLIKIDAALNVVMNPAKQIMHAVFGSPREVMTIGIPFSQAICQTRVKQGRLRSCYCLTGWLPQGHQLVSIAKGIITCRQYYA